jgi:hypothetical protein
MLLSMSLRVFFPSFELPSMLDAMHLAAFCSQISPLACLPVINAMAKEFDHHDAAQHAVN